MSRQAYLEGEFFHGTARRTLAFSPSMVAYLTQSRIDALRYAEMDAEVDQGAPHLLRVRLSCRNPALLDTIVMQDLHDVHTYGAFVQELIDRGHDCAVSDNPDHDEIAVFGAATIDVVETTKLECGFEDEIRRSSKSPSRMD